MANNEQHAGNDNSFSSQELSGGDKHSPSLTPTILARLGLGNTYVSKDAPVEELIATLHNSLQWQAQAEAAHKLGKQGGKEAIGPLEAALMNKEPAVRAAAARLLGELEEYARPEPLRTALNDENDRVRVAASWALERLKDFWLVSLSDPDETVRAEAAQKLGELGKDAPVEELEAALDDSSERVCKAVVHALGVIWQQMSTSALVPISRQVETQIPSERRLKGRTMQSGNVAFEAIEPADLAQSDSVPVVAQALDNQWVPRTLLNSMLKGKISYTEAAKYLEGLVRTEYIRALINGEQVIINRAFLYNNPLLFQDYLPGKQNRDAFKNLLAKGVIIPFLVNERHPDERPEFHLVPEGFTAWAQLCQEVQMQCMRFSWNDDEEQNHASQKLAEWFYELALTAEAKDIPKLMQDLRVDLREENELRDRLAEVANTAQNHFRAQIKGGKNPYITRNILYKNFVTAGESPAERHYDGSKPFAGEIKQMFDLAYNAYLADLLGGHLLTPIDSPTRLLLQEWKGSDRGKKQLTVNELVNMLRHNAFSLMSQGLYLKSMGLLSLQDVQEIRKTDQWLLYIKSLQRLLKEPARFHELANNVYLNYTALAREITNLIEQRNLQQGGVLIAPWDPSVNVLVTVGNASLSVIWNQDGTFYHVNQATLHAQSLTAGVAPFSVRLTIGDPSSSSRRSHDQAQLFSSIDIMKGVLPAARQQWEEITRRFKEALEFQEFSPQEAAVTAPTINEQEQR